METQFYILISLKKENDPESFARFFIGNNREHAYRIFRRLKSTGEISEKDILYLEFMETRENLPVNLEMISCNLSQLAENCKIITKEIFKMSLSPN